MKSYLPIVSLDLGSTKTTMCLGVLDSSGQMEVTSAVMVKTKGIERGIITNIGEVSSGIEEVVRKTEIKWQTAERSSKGIKKRNFKVSSVYVTIGGEHVIGNNTKGMLSLSNHPVEITHNDTNRAIDSAKSLTTSIDRQTLHALAQDFIVDGYNRTRQPRGIYGTRLGVNAHIISAGTAFINSLINAVNRAGLDVEGIVYAGLATGFSMITEEEKQSGVIFLELGAGTINVLLFKNGSLQYTSVISMGGNDITLAIAESLGVDLAQAEQLKMQYKSICAYSGGENSTCDDKIIIKKNSSQYESISRHELAEVIEKSLSIIISRIKQDIVSSGIYDRVTAGVVISGGMSFMDGIMEKLEVMLKLPVRLGIMRGFISSFPGLSNSFYATSIGLIMNVLQDNGSASLKSMSKRSFVDKIVTQVKDMYEEYF